MVPGSAAGDLGKVPEAVLRAPVQAEGATLRPNYTGTGLRMEPGRMFTVRAGHSVVVAANERTCSKHGGPGALLHCWRGAPPNSVAGAAPSSLQSSFSMPGVVPETRAGCANNHPAPTGRVTRFVKS